MQDESLKGDESHESQRLVGWLIRLRSSRTEDDEMLLVCWLFGYWLFDWLDWIGCWIGLLVFWFGLLVVWFVGLVCCLLVCWLILIMFAVFITTIYHKKRFGWLVLIFVCSFHNDKPPMRKGLGLGLFETQFVSTTVGG